MQRLAQDHSIQQALLPKLAIALVHDDADELMRLIFPFKIHSVDTKVKRASVGMSMMSLLPHPSDTQADTIEKDLQDLVKYGPEGLMRSTRVAALLAAAKYGYAACVSALLAAYDGVPSKQVNVTGKVALLGSETEAGFAFILACANQQVAVVNVLLNDSRVDVSASDHTAIKWACEGGNITIVEMMLKNVRVDPSGDNNSPICGASGKGRLDVVKVLLKDTRVDPSAQIDGAIRNACFGGHLDIATLLLTDDRVDPAADKNYALRWACRNGHLPVVDLLLTDPRVDPKAVDSCCIRWACLNSKLDVVQCLLNDGRADPGSKGNRVAIKQALVTNSVDVLDLLLSDVRVVKSLENDDSLLDWACMKGHIGIVQRLLNADWELCTTKKAMRSASRRGNTEIIKLMFQDVRVRKEWCFTAVDPDTNTVLKTELLAMHQPAARTFALCVLRCEGKVVLARVNDVVREAFRDFASLIYLEHDLVAPPHWRNRFY